MTPGTALANIYTLLCADPDTAEGGLTPASTDLHAPCFSRAQGVKLEDLAPDGIDRRLEVQYSGIDKWHTLGDMVTFEAIIRVGYFAGEHKDDTYGVMSSDEHLIGRCLNFSGNWVGAAMITQPGSITDLGDDRFVLEIPVALQID